MKPHRKTMLALVAVLTIAGLALGAMVVLAQERADQSQAAAEAAVPAAAAAPRPQGQPEDPAVAQGGRAIVAKGMLMPIEHAALSMTAGGVVSETLVREGDAVTAGQVILRLRNERQQAAVAEAEGAVAAARAQLDTLKAGARVEQLAAAQAGLDAAAARVAQLQEGGRKGDLAAARANVQAAQASLARLYTGADENTRIAAQADLANAEAAVRNAQAAFDKVKDQPNVAMLPQSLQLEQATNAYNAAKSRLDEVNAPPKSDRVAQASAAVKQAQAELDRLIDPTTAADLAEADAAVRQAQAQLDLLKAGPRQQEIAAAQAAVTQAEAGLKQAQAALSDTELPRSLRRDAGRAARAAGRAGDPRRAGCRDRRPERVAGGDGRPERVGRGPREPGQDVRVSFDAIPGLELKGTVERVQPKGEKKLGDMTYTAVVRLQNPDPRLLWNMTAVVNVP